MWGQAQQRLGDAELYGVIRNLPAYENRSLGTSSWSLFTLSGYDVSKGVPPSWRRPLRSSTIHSFSKTGSPGRGMSPHLLPLPHRPSYPHPRFYPVLNDVVEVLASSTTTCIEAGRRNLI